MSVKLREEKIINIGEIWWVHFPFSDEDREKRRPAVILDNENIAILTLYVTSKNADNPYSISIDDWKESGLAKESWVRIDKIVQIQEWNIESKIGDLSERDFKKIFQLSAEIITKSFHEFSIIAISNENGELLLNYDERWNCWLFPYMRTTDTNKQDVDTFVSEILHEDVVTTYVKVAKHCKFSVSDDTYKVYNHKLYKLDLTSKIKADFSAFEGKKYKWMSFSEMEADDNIMDKNEEIVAFVKSSI